MPSKLSVSPGGAHQESAAAQGHEVLPEWGQGRSQVPGELVDIGEPISAAAGLKLQASIWLISSLIVPCGQKSGKQ